MPSPESRHMITSIWCFIPHDLPWTAGRCPAPVLRVVRAVLAPLLAATVGVSGEQIDTQVHGRVQEPCLGFWVGASPDSTTALGDWLNRPVLLADASSMYHPFTSWEEMEQTRWLGTAWEAWALADERRQVVTIVPLMPSTGASWADGATGAYDGHYAAIASSLVQKHCGSAIIRLGGAFNAGGPGSVRTRADAADFIRTWQHAVTAMRSVSGTNHLAFVWGGTNERTAYALDDAYPGNASVDYVGVEVMDRSLDPSAYPYPSGATASERLHCQTQAWELTEYSASDNGLAAWIALARAHGKPLGITQWGLYADHHNQCGYDNPYYIQRMHDVIADPANRVAFALYFNYYHCSKISPTGWDGTNYPVSSALFHDVFALPAR